MKKGWDIRPLAAICGFEGGAQPPKSEFIYEPRPGYIRFLQIRDFAGDKNATFVPESKKNRICCENDTMLARYGASVGKILVGRAGAYNVALMKAIPNFSVITREWLRYYLTGEDFQARLLSIASRSAQDGFSKADIAAFPVPIPPLPEQRRIVGILDEAFAGLATAEANAARNLQNAREIFDSHLHAVFSQRGEGWVERRLEDVCQILSALVDPRDGSLSKMTHVGAGNIESQTGRLVDLKTAEDEGLISGKFLFNESTVLYSKIRPYLMKVARPTFSGLCSADMYPLSPDLRLVNRDFLFYTLLTKHFTEYAVAGSARAGMPKVNRDHLFAYKVALPPVEVQAALARVLDDVREQVNSLSAVYERKQSVLADLKKSLLHEAFSGML